MITSKFPSIFAPLAGLVFSATAMASLSLHVQKTKKCLDLIGLNLI